MSAPVYVSKVTLTPSQGTNTLSGSYTLVKGDASNGGDGKRLLVILISFADSQVTGQNLVSACTYNSVAATSQVTSNPGGSARVVANIRTLNDANLPTTAGAYTLSITSSDSITDYMIATVIEYSNVDQTTPVNSNKPTSTAFGTSASLTPSTAGDMQIGVLASYNGATFTVSTSDTQRANDVTYNGGVVYGGHCVAETTDGTINFSQSLDTTTEAAVAISINGVAVVVPVLTSPTGTATGASTATGTVDTDTANGTMYAVVTSSATKPTAAQVKSGLNNGGTSAIWGGSQAISSTGTKTLNASGLTTGLQQYFHYMHENATGGQSTVATSSAFTPAGTASLATVSADNIVLLGETGAKAVGANFGDTTGTASIVAAGVTQAQTITGWSSATAVFSFAQGNLPYGSATFQLITGG